jgi:hypothetical protein
METESNIFQVYKQESTGLYKLYKSLIKYFGK